ncbi:MAG: DUF1997 domain-containing protein [Spirulinaceae cyanobacterium]
MSISFTASENLQLGVVEKSVPIKHYLRQPQRLVKAIANPKLMTQLGKERFELRMNPLNFMEMYHFQPVVVLKVWSSSKGTVYLKSESCKIEGNNYINDRFSLDVTGKLSPQEQQGRTLLVGRADLEVRVDLPPLLQFTPNIVLEKAGNGLLKSVLLRIKQTIKSQLIQDYQQWLKDNSSSENISKSSDLSIVKHSTI